MLLQRTPLAACVFGGQPSVRRTLIQARAAATATRPSPVVAGVDVVSSTEPAYAFVEDSTQFDHGFDEYRAATQQMADLQKLSQELLSNLEEINSLSMQTLVSKNDCVFVVNCAVS